MPTAKPEIVRRVLRVLAAESDEPETGVPERSPRCRFRPEGGVCAIDAGMDDGVQREKQRLIDFLCASAGGPVYYRGRDMTLCPRGMRITERDWTVFLGHAGATLAKLQVPEAEQRDVVAFAQGLRAEIVE